EVRRMGGGFGGKESQGNLPACAAALAAAKTGRPAKCVYDRDDDMVVTGKRHDARIAYRVGFDETGRILGLEVDQEIRCGWSWDLSEPVADRAMFHADNCYHLPAARIRSRRWRTHTCSNTAFRGFGGPQGMLGAEKVVEDVARALGRDPLEVRRRTFYPSAAAVAAAPEPPEAARTPYGMLVEDCVIQEIVDALTESAGYARRRDEIAAWNAAEPVLKRGLAIAPVKFGISFTKSFMNQAGALVHVYSDGSVQLNHGGAEMGQGLFVKVAQVTADAFGLPLSAVKITATTTGKVPNTAPTAASSGTDLNGMAAQRAALAIRARMAARFAEEAGCAPEAVRFEEGRVRGGSLEMRFGALARACHLARVSLSSTGFYATPKISWDKASGTGRPFFYFAYGAAVVEAAVDALTGEHRLLAADILHDCGRSLNPAIDIGQIEGGFVQGVGWLTTEELAWDREGRLRTHSPSTYKIPTAADRPRRMRIRLWERGENREETIYRSKAVGEPPLMLANAAFFAIADAVAACAPERGATTPSPLHAPATPERVLAAIAALRGGG
ncbi:MAG: xanthine dehydrogenase molybdopterin binding subunit, partial [Pseudomonadota bacterium]